MYVVTTPYGGTYRNTDGLPVIVESVEQLERMLRWQPLREWELIEVSKREAQEIAAQACLAIHGAQFGLGHLL